MLSTNAIFQRKLSSLESQPCTIEAIEEMDHEIFEEFSESLICNHQFIADRKKDMFIDSAGVIHGLLALDMESGDGILIDSQGYDYARYAAFMPNIKPHIDRQISIVVDQVIQDACLNSNNGRYAFDTYQINKDYGLPVRENNGIGGMFLKELETREQLNDIELDDDVFYVNVKEQFIGRTHTEEPSMTM